MAKGRRRAGTSRRRAVPHRKRWASETVYIVGGGPSAGRYDLSTLHQRGLVVAVNDSAARLPYADVIFTASPPWVRHRKKLVHAHRGQLVIRTSHSPRIIHRWKLPPDTVVIPLRSANGITDAELREGHNSGTEAIYWAVSRGARRIVLIGFDMEPGRAVHWHGGYEWMTKRMLDKEGREKYPLWARATERVAEDLESAGVKCWNANPESAIRAWPFTELDLPVIQPPATPKAEEAEATVGVAV
jgi:uncharacterized Rossmann fold enzyme